MNNNNQLRYNDELNIEEPINETKPMVYNSDGSLVEFPGDCLIELLRPGRFNIKNFTDRFQDYTESVLNELLKMQTNDIPLKKGGQEIAYRMSSLIRSNRQNFTARENTILDIFLGVVSSFPHDKSYQLKLKDYRYIFPDQDVSAINHLFDQPLRTLKQKSLKFEAYNEEGVPTSIDITWYLVCTKERAEDGTYIINFVPTPFFKMLAISSTITHGAHYKEAIAARINSENVRSLYYLLEDFKDYKQYPSSVPGSFRVSLDDLRVMIGYPISYSAGDIKRNIITPGLKEINSFTDLDFTFTANFIAAKPKGKGRTAYDSIDFKITKVIKEEKKFGKDDDLIKGLLKAYSFTKPETFMILKSYYENKRDLIFFTKALAKLENVKYNKASYLETLMKKGIIDIPQLPKKENSFNTMIHSDYDFEEIEKDILK